METDRVQERIAGYSGYAYPVLRVGLGMMVVLAGVHKLVNPTIWSSYIAPWALTVLQMAGIPADLFMRANGVVETVAGLAILGNRYTTVAAGLISLSLLGIVINMVTAGGAFLDVLIRDIGLLALAVGVTLLAAERR
ncbi:MAG: DoxX family membrane protein [Candidatus Nanohaloarchaea archaeon]|nr:DoxX family membrane protein [Candidatus Nanohaloarchaea archaeon]